MDKLGCVARVTIILGLQGFACSGSGSAGSAQSEGEAVTPEARAAAQTLYQERCAQCHGATGRGDGPKAAELEAKPRDFSDVTWHLAVSDRHIDRAIREGGVGVGKSRAMEANPELAKQPVLLAALRQYVRELARRPE